MRATASIAVILALSTAAFAQDSVDRIEVVGKGIYQVTIGEPTPDPAAPTGTTAAPVAFNLIESTSTVAAALGVEFGLAYRVVGAPDGAEVTLDVVNIYPGPGLADPDKAEPIRENRYQRAKKVGEVNYLGYGFEQDWEMVPGSWTFQIWHDGRQLLEESFTVTN
jgi:hypothetical protein